MKNIVAASFAALLLASTVAANAGSRTTEPAAGAPAAPAISVASNTGNATAAPLMPAQSRPAMAAHAAPRHTNGINPWDVNLATQTGYGR